MHAGKGLDMSLMERVRRLKLSDYVLSASFAFNFAYLGLAIYSASAPSHFGDFFYYFQRGGIRINDWLSRTTRSLFGQELVLWLSIVSIASLLFVLVDLLPRRSRLPQGAFTALLAFSLPIACLIEMRTSGLILGTAPDSIIRWTVFQQLLLLELGFMFLVVCWCEFRGDRFWAESAALFLHALGWSFAVFTISPLRYLTAVRFSLCLFPVAVVLWQRQRRSAQRNAESADASAKEKRSLTPALSLLLLSLLIWLPFPLFGFRNPDRPETLRVTLQRAGCFGSCPVYRVTIDAQGFVEYYGQENVATCGQVRTKIDPATGALLLKQANEIHFFSMEDRAFQHCPDAYSSWVSIAVDGRVTEVGGYDCGKGSWPSVAETQFLKFAQEIDRKVASDQWVRGARRNCEADSRRAASQDR
jgi:hypothetical protein